MYEVKIKKIAAIKTISKKAVVPNFEESGELNMTMFREVRQHVLEHGAGMPAYDIALYHGIPGQTELSLEVAIPVAEDIPAKNSIAGMTLPEHEAVACVIHYGSFDNYHLAHMALQEWMQANDYIPAGAIRDVYLVFDASGDPEKWVTELQYPVQKAG